MVILDLPTLLAKRAPLTDTLVCELRHLTHLEGPNTRLAWLEWLGAAFKNGKWVPASARDNLHILLDAEQHPVFARPPLRPVFVPPPGSPKLTTPKLNMAHENLIFEQAHPGHNPNPSPNTNPKPLTLGLALALALTLAPALTLTPSPSSSPSPSPSSSSSPSPRP